MQQETGQAQAWPDGPREARREAVAAAPVLPARRLALFGLPSALAEPVTMIADILGWQVTSLPPGPAMMPPADLCLAMLPADPQADPPAPLPPIAVWSPERNLNEHIFSLGLSIMEQPPCIQHLEQLLQICCEMP